MTKEEKIRGNKLIFEFLNPNSEVRTWFSGKGYDNYCLRRGYHGNWNSLMKVIEKIEKIDETKEKYGTLCTIGTNHIKIGSFELDHKNNDYTVKIDGVYHAIISFIKLYNIQEKLKIMQEDARRYSL